MANAELRDLPPRERTYKVSDGGNGLYVVTSPSGSRSFRDDYWLGGRRDELRAVGDAVLRSARYEPMWPSFSVIQSSPCAAAARRRASATGMSLGAESRGLRFHGGVKPDAYWLLSQLTHADGSHHIAFVAVRACDDGELIVGEARAARGDPGEPAEFATAVAGEVLTHNARMGGFMQREGFVVAGASEAGVQRWQRTLVVLQPRRWGWLAWLGGHFGVGCALHAA